MAQHPEEKEGITQICVSDKSNVVKFATIDEIVEEIAEKLAAKSNAKEVMVEINRAVAASPSNRGGES